MMTVDAELMAAIVAAPDDDGPRMVYADHLMQRGDPRGEFIALQCRIARADAEDQPIEDTVIAREHELRTRHADEWTAPLREILPAAGYVFRRGLVEHATVWNENTIAVRDTPDLPDEVPEWPELFESLLEAAPLLRSIATGGELMYRKLQPAWRSIRALTLYASSGGADRVAALTRELPALSRLQLTCSSITNDAARAWLGITQPLEHLGFHVGWHVTAQPERDVVPEQIAANRALCGLRSLHLGGFRVGDLAPLACLAQLERLCLHRTQASLEEIIAFVGTLPKLAMLELDNDDKKLGRFDVPGLLAAAPLRRLVVRTYGLRGKHVRALASSPHAASLRYLELDDCEVGDAGAELLLESPHLRDLVSLRITHDDLSPQIAARVRARDRHRWDPAPVPYPRDVTQYLSTNKIMSIKEWRSLTQQGLADSKMAVERIHEELGLGVVTPAAYRTAPRWCRP